MTNIFAPDFREAFTARQLEPVSAVPTPFARLNDFSGDDGGKVGSADGWFIVVGGNPKHGKALALDTPMPTPNGWTTMGELSVGDVVFDERGRPCTVTFATDTMTDHQCFRVVFSDGEEIIADADHEWVCHRRRIVKDPKARYDVQVVKTTTVEMSRDYLWSGGKTRYSIPATGGLELPDADLPIEPYLFGLWLGDGSARSGQLTIADADAGDLREILAHKGITLKKLSAPLVYSVGAKRGRAQGTKLTRADARVIAASGERGVDLAEQYGVSTATVSLIKSGKLWAGEAAPPSLYMKLKALGVIQNKHIPAMYLRASKAQRMELLRGLMDSDGHCVPAGSSELTTTSALIADGALELIRGLGYIPRMGRGRATLNGVDHGPKYRIRWRAYADEPVFRLPRKAARLPHRPSGGHIRRSGHRSVVSIEPVDSVPVRCIQVSSRSHLYLAGRGMVPTHNTILAINWLWTALASGRSPMFVSLEMNRWQVATRLYAMMSGTELWRLEKRNFRREQFNEIWRTLDPIRNDLTFYVDDTPLTRTDEIIASMQAHADMGADFFVVDYLQLAALGNDDQINRAVIEATTHLRHFAKTVNKPVVVLSQFNRQTSANYTDSPTVQGLHGGMIVEASADQILLIDHSRYEKLDGKARTWLTLTNRHGPSDDIPIEYVWDKQTVYQGDEDLEDLWPTH